MWATADIEIFVAYKVIDSNLVKVMDRDIPAEILQCFLWIGSEKHLDAVRQDFHR